MRNASQELDEALLLPGFLANATGTASAAGKPKSQRVIQVLCDPYLLTEQHNLAW